MSLEGTGGPRDVQEGNNEQILPPVPDKVRVDILLILQF